MHEGAYVEPAGKQLAIIWTTEHGGHLDTMFDDRRIYLQLLRNVHGIVDYLSDNLSNEHARVFEVRAY